MRLQIKLPALTLDSRPLGKENAILVEPKRRHGAYRELRSFIAILSIRLLFADHRVATDWANAGSKSFL